MVTLAIDEIEASQHDATLNGGSTLVCAGVAALHPLHVRMQQGARQATLHGRKGGFKGRLLSHPRLVGQDPGHSDAVEPAPARLRQ